MYIGHVCIGHDQADPPLIYEHIYDNVGTPFSLQFCATKRQSNNVLDQLEVGEHGHSAAMDRRDMSHGNGVFART
eukprot:SAG31_NODE_356_length_17180_cov_7.595925_16_plen_75_part_00